MTTPISESWTRIENWLAEHAPATYAAPVPPPDPADMAAAERVIGRPLLKPLVTSLSRHDGLLDQRFSLLPGFYRPMSAREIAAEWQLFTGFHDKRTADEEGEEADYGFMKIGASNVLYGHPQLIPIARDVRGGCLVLDHRPEKIRASLAAGRTGGVPVKPRAPKDWKKPSRTARSRGSSSSRNRCQRLPT
jgi:cell wall assembly regulator SMI1